MKTTWTDKTPTTKSLTQRLEMFIQVLIVASLVAFSVETLPDLSTTSKLWLERFEQFSILVFVIEYLTRLWFAKNRRAFVFSFFGLVDLFAIMPFFLATTIDLRSARALRLLRVFRILKLARYNAAVHRFHVALMLAKEEIILFMILTSIVLGSEQEMISLETSECEIVCDWIDEQSQGRDSCNHQFVVKR